MGEPGPSRKIIIPRGVLEQGNNVVEIPESCEDSRVLIAKLQAQQKPPRHYPPQSNPNYKVQRNLGDGRVNFGLPPLSPMREEDSSYETSFGQYGSHWQSSEADSSHGSSPRPQPRSPGSDRSYSLRDLSDLMSPSPVRRRLPPGSSPIQSPQSDRSYSFGDASDLLSPSPVRGRVPPRGSPDRSCTSRDISALLSPSPPRRHEERRTPPARSPQQGSPQPGPSRDIRDLMSPSPPRRQVSPVSSPQREPPQPVEEAVRRRSPRAPQSGLSPVQEEHSSYEPSFGQYGSYWQSSVDDSSYRTPPRVPRGSPIADFWDQSCSSADISDLVSPSPLRGRGYRQPRFIDSDASVSTLDASDLMSPPRTRRGARRVPIPTELDNSVVNESLENVEAIELNELRTVQDRMRNFQEARRELVVSVLSLQEVDV